MSVGALRWFPSKRKTDDSLDHHSVKLPDDASHQLCFTVNAKKTSPNHAPCVGNNYISENSVLGFPPLCEGRPDSVSTGGLLHDNAEFQVSAPTTNMHAEAVASQM